MPNARWLLLAATLFSGAGCVVVEHHGDAVLNGCDSDGCPIDAAGCQVEDDPLFAPRPAIPREALRRAPPPPEPVPPGRFSPVPVRPVFSPQPPLAW